MITTFGLLFILIELTYGSVEVAFLIALVLAIYNTLELLERCVKHGRRAYKKIKHEQKRVR